MTKLVFRYTVRLRNCVYVIANMTETDLYEDTFTFMEAIENIISSLLLDIDFFSTTIETEDTLKKYNILKEDQTIQSRIRSNQALIEYYMAVDPDDLKLKLKLN